MKDYLSLGAQQIVDECVAKALIDLDDPDIVIDLRRLNGRVTNDKFNPFWDELQAYLDELGLAVDERRHSGVLHMPIAVSIRHLRDIISERLSAKTKESSEDVAIPSEEWIRYQFWPKNPYSASALRYTGRFSIKFGVQSHQLRKSHADAHYVNSLLQYVKVFCVKYREYTLYVSADDKAIVPIGEPDLPVSTGVRGHHRSLVPASGSSVMGLDHDFHVHGIVPSVALFVSIPNDVHGEFYRGSVVVTLKDKVTQPSNSFRHVTELAAVVGNLHSTDNVTSDNPIFVIVTDGGPDHRLTYVSVKFSYLALFLYLNLDMLVAVRTCPYQSWTNLAERVMSTLNLALQNVSLARSRMDEEAESIVKGKKTMAEVKKAVERNPSLRKQLQESLNQPKNTLSSCFASMKLKDEPIRVFNGAPDIDIQTVFEQLHYIDPSLKMDNLTKEVLEASIPMKTFLSEHSCSTSYSFQLKKCSSSTCFYCGTSGKPRLPQDIFSSLSWLPLPLLDSTKEHYQAFESVYGKPVSSQDQPSLQSKFEDPEAAAADEANKALFNASKVRDVIWCQECYKPRCIFSRGKLTFTEMIYVQDVKDSCLFTCGSCLFPPTSELTSVIVVRQNSSCSLPVEAQYYSAKLVSFPPVCYYCGLPEQSLVNDDEIVALKQQYAVVRPICFFCKAEGKQVHTSHPSNMAKRPKK